MHYSEKYILKFSLKQILYYSVIMKILRGPARWIDWQSACSVPQNHVKSQVWFVSLTVSAGKVDMGKIPSVCYPPSREELVSCGFSEQSSL